MSEKPEISEVSRGCRTTGAEPVAASLNGAAKPVSKRSRNPVQGGERRYERTLEEDEDLGDAEGGHSHDGSNNKSAKSAGPRAKHYVAYTIKLPSDQLSALQSIWLELKKLYGTHSPDKSGMIQAAIDAWLKRWDGPDRDKLLEELLDIRESTRRRQYRKGKN